MLTETIINAGGLTLLSSILILLFKNYQKIILKILEQNDKHFEIMTNAINQVNDNLIEHVTLVENETKIMRRH